MSALASSLLEKIQARRARTGVVGLGYVGLPLAVELARPGSTRPASISTPARSKRSRTALVHSRRVHRRRRGAARQPASSTRRPTSRSCSELDTINICVPTPLRKTKDPDMSYIVSAVESIAEHLHPGLLVCLESTTYSGHDGGSGAAAARGNGAQGGPRLLPGVLARARRSWQPDVPDPQRAEGRRRPDARVRAAGERRSTARAIKTIVPVSSTRVAEMVKLAREHVPGGQHRSRQRAGADVRPHGHRCVGSCRRGENEAVRLHGLLSRSRARRTLHPDRSVLPVVEGQAEWVRSAVHRARRPHQRQHAALRRREDCRGAQHEAQGDQRLEDAHRRRGLQAGYRRHARVPGARRHGTAPRARRRSVVYRSARARSPRARVVGTIRHQGRERVAADRSVSTTAS